MRTLGLRWSAEVSPSQLSCFLVLTAGRISATSRCLPAPTSTCIMFDHHHRSSSSTPFLTVTPRSLEILPAVYFAFKHFPRLNSKPSTFSRPRNNTWPLSPPYIHSCHRPRFSSVPLVCHHFTHTCSNSLLHGRSCIFRARHTQRNCGSTHPTTHSLSATSPPLASLSQYSTHSHYVTPSLTLHTLSL